VSSHNYPGGNAMTFFNGDYKLEMEKNELMPSPYIHVDVYPAMTGITRFSYTNEEIGWKYNRTEHLSDSDMMVYTHLFSDRNDYPNFKIYKSPFKSFKSLNIMKFLKDPFTERFILLEDTLYILEREDIFI
jgi:hypothetical protein